MLLQVVTHHGGLGRAEWHRLGTRVLKLHESFPNSVIGSRQLGQHLLEYLVIKSFFPAQACVRRDQHVGIDFVDDAVGEWGYRLH